MKSPRSAPGTAGFTLIELLVVITIIGMLIGLMAPAIGRAQDRAKAVKCMGNLRSVGVATQLYTQDNDGRFPKIEGMPSDPYYQPDDEAKPILEVLGPYGLTAENLKCPADLAGSNYFAKEGSSFMWSPRADDEPVSAIKMYFRRRSGDPVVIPASRVSLATDFKRVAGHFNVLFADGTVRMR